MRGSELAPDRDSHIIVHPAEQAGLRSPTPFATTRFDALGDAAAKVPFGVTVPEMAALMGALGCRRAVSLDGGISGQLAVRETGGTLRKWTAWRLVPLGLLVYADASAVGS